MGLRLFKKIINNIIICKNLLNIYIFIHKNNTFLFTEKKNYINILFAVYLNNIKKNNLQIIKYIL